MTLTNNRILLSLFAMLFSSVAIGQPVTQCQNFREALEIAASLRGIKPIGKQQCLVLEEEEFDRRIRALARNNMTTRAIEAEEFIVKALSLVPSTFPYAKCIYDGADAAIVAVYDHQQKDIILRSSSTSSLALLVHEAVHMLQDHKYNLGRFFNKFSKTTDLKMAISAIVEGDAIRIQRIADKKILQENLDEEQNISDVCVLPPQMADILYFPYDFGELYFNREKDLLDVDLLFEKPPVNTATVLNPSFTTRMISKQKNSHFLCTIADESCYPVIAEDSLGQYYLQSVLNVFLDKARSLAAAVGWQNDHILVAMNSKRTEGILRWNIDTLSTKDSIELWDALIKWLEVRNNIKLQSGTNRVYIEGRDRYSSFKVIRAGTTITLEIFYRLKDKD